MSPKVLQLRAFRQTRALFLTAQKRIIQSIPATQTCYVLLRRIASVIISSQILLMVYFVKSGTTKPRKVDPEQHIVHAFLPVAESLFDCGAKIRRLRLKQPLKHVSQGFFSQFSAFEPSNMLESEVCCPLAIANVPRSTPVTCIPANQSPFPHSAKKNNTVHSSHSNLLCLA